MESSRLFPRQSRKNISVQRICGVWSVTLVLSANCKNITGCQLWSKGHLVGLANVNLSFTHFLFPNMICWLCSVAKQIRRRVRPSRGKYFLVFCRRNSAILTCLILYVNMGKCPFLKRQIKLIFYTIYVQINQLSEYLYTALKQYLSYNNDNEWQWQRHGLGPFKGLVSGLDKPSVLLVSLSWSDFIN